MRAKGCLITALGGLALLGVGPFLVPVPSLHQSAPRDLADSDSRFATLCGLDVHYKMRGAGEPYVLMLHGFGASVFSWRTVVESLSSRGTVVAYDRPPFGLTERPLRGDWAEGENPYAPAAQLALAIGLLDHLGVDKAIWMGHSAGGTLAVYAALEHPERVASLVLVSPAILRTGGPPRALRPILGTRQMRHLGPLIVREAVGRADSFLARAVHDETWITDDVRAGYHVPFRTEGWDTGLWEYALATDYPDLVRDAQALSIPVLLVTGDDDRVVPTEDTVSMAGTLSRAQLVVIPQCGHLAHEECPDAFLGAVRAFVDGGTLNED